MRANFSTISKGGWEQGGKVALDDKGILFLIMKFICSNLF